MLVDCQLILDFVLLIESDRAGAENKGYKQAEHFPE